MNKLLETLYHSMYTPLEQVELQKEISSCHHQLTERLDKPEHKLLLKLVDDYDHLADMQSMDNFLCGLKLFSLRFSFSAMSFFSSTDLALSYCIRASSRRRSASRDHFSNSGLVMVPAFIRAKYFLYARWCSFQTSLLRTLSWKLVVAPISRQILPSIPGAGLLQ